MGIVPTREQSKSNLEGNQFWRRQSPLFCPRWASRIALRVTDVRVQRLQDISETDAVAEGCYDNDNVHTGIGYADNREAFCCRWDQINAREHPWASNPWVWAYTLARMTDAEVRAAAA